ncbi:MAG: hypothetical protein RBJ76_17395 [Stenomitos frigidus ULC029]
MTLLKSPLWQNFAAIAPPTPVDSPLTRHTVCLAVKTAATEALAQPCPKGYNPPLQVLKPYEC